MSTEPLHVSPLETGRAHDTFEMAARSRSMLTGAITTPYSVVDAFMYDFLFAPAVLQMANQELVDLAAAVPPDARVLDVGCGGGQTALLLGQRRTDLELVGIDLCADQVRRAERRTRAIASRASFQVANVMSLPFPTASFDAVLSVTAIKHWPSMTAGIRECVRVLKPGGELRVVEVDRGCHLDHARRVLAHSRVPRAFSTVALPLLRTYIMGRGIDLDEARALVQNLPLEAPQVARIGGFAGIVIRAKRANRAPTSCPLAS